MNNIIKFNRATTKVSEAALAIARAVIINNISPDELFAAVDVICAEVDE